MEVRIRAFRAPDFPEECDKYIDGHQKILSSIGVEQLTSASKSWKEDPCVFVVLCESMDGEKVYGGAKIHVVNNETDLPFVEATRNMDDRVPDLVNSVRKEGAGEFCGLWNSLEVAGFGIGAVYLIRASVAIIGQLKLKSMFALCSPYTARIARSYGFLKDRRVGNSGTFYYPKIDLLATVTLLADSESLEFADEYERKRIFNLRENNNQTIKENNRGHEVVIEYNLKVDNIDFSNFSGHL